MLCHSILFHKYHVNVKSETISCTRNTNCIYHLVEVYAIFDLTTEFFPNEFLSLRVIVAVAASVP